MPKKFKLYIALTTIFSLILIEASVRALGFVDFPVYDLDDEVKYMPSANQSGRFMNENDWYFNNKSMPIRENWSPAGNKNILLIGNSIVMGGNPYKQSDKLVSQMQVRLSNDNKVWPIAVGGWNQPNEIAYLRLHPEIVSEASYVAWEYMSGGLARATPWRGEYVFPSHKPTYATWYVLCRYVLPRFLPAYLVSELPATGDAEPANIMEFERRLQTLTIAIKKVRSGIIWLYPNSAQVGIAERGEEWLPERAKIEELAKSYGLRVVDVAARTEWSRTFYRDGVHPTVEGNKVLAGILASEIMHDLER